MRLFGRPVATCRMYVQIADQYCIGGCGRSRWPRLLILEYWNILKMRSFICFEVQSTGAFPKSGNHISQRYRRPEPRTRPGCHIA